MTAIEHHINERINALRETSQNFTSCAPRRGLHLSQFSEFFLVRAGVFPHVTDVENMPPVFIVPDGGFSHSARSTNLPSVTI
jgi:hypothetical protein